MELQVGIACFVITSILSLIVYAFIYFSSLKEDSFEEAKANQRKIIKQFRETTKTGGDKIKEKKIKKMNKKSKKTEPEKEEDSNKENEKEHHQKEVKEKPVEKVVAPPPSKAVSLPAAKAPPSKESVPPGKVGPEKAAPAKAKVVVDKPKEVKIPKKRNEEPSQPKPNESLVTKQVEESVKEVVPQTQEAPKGSSNKSSKKKKVEATATQLIGNEKTAVNVAQLTSYLLKAELSKSEIQQLIDVLCNKQQDGVGEWSTGGKDPLAKLQKQLAETEESLKAEKENSLGLQAKLKELRQSILVDRAAVRNSEEALAAARIDCKALANKLQAAEEGHIQKMQLVNNQLIEEKRNLAKLKEEHASLKDEYCESIALQSQLAAQCQDLQGVNNSLSEQLMSTQSMMEESCVTKEELERLLSASKYESARLRNELIEAQRAFAEDMAKVQARLNASEKEKHGLHEQAERHLNQYNTVSREMQSVKEQYEALKKQSENCENGYSYNNKQDLTEYQTRLDELSNEIQLKNNKIDELNLSLINFKNESLKKEVLLEKANSELSSQIEKKTEANKAEADEAITKLKNLLNDKNRELSQVRTELESCKSKNNEIRNRNWKIAEALTIAEQSLQNKIINEQNSYENKISPSESEIKDWLKRLIKHFHPEVEIEDSKISLVEWLKKIEEKLEFLHPNNGTEPQTLSYSQLEALVRNYKNIITETEGILNQLQRNVEVEETRWNEKVSSLEKELEILRQNQKQC